MCLINMAVIRLKRTLNVRDYISGTRIDVNEHLRSNKFNIWDTNIILLA